MGDPDREFLVDNEAKMESIHAILVDLPRTKNNFTFTELVKVANRVADSVIDLCGGELVYEDGLDQADKRYKAERMTEQLLESQNAHHIFTSTRGENL